MRLFSGTSEGGRLVLTNADLALDRGEIDAALQILTSVTPDKA